MRKVWWVPTVVVPLLAALIPTWPYLFPADTDTRAGGLTQAGFDKAVQALSSESTTLRVAAVQQLADYTRIPEFRLEASQALDEFVADNPGSGLDVRTARDAIGTDVLRVATFNLQNLAVEPRGDHAPDLATRVSVMRPQLEQLRADVLCLQEISGHRVDDQPLRLTALDRLIHQTPYADYARAATWKGNNPGDGVGYIRNLVILSRFPIQRQHQYLNTVTEAPVWRPITARDDTGRRPEARPYSWERPILHAEIEITPGRVLHVFNVHLKSRLPTRIEGQRDNWYRWASPAGLMEGAFLSQIKRTGQALELRMILDRLLDDDPTSEIVVCGDFSAEPHDPAVQGLTNLDTRNSNHARHNLFSVSQKIPPHTRYTIRMFGNQLEHDYILLSDALQTRLYDAEILNQQVADESLAHAHDATHPRSDHAPVVAELRYPTGTLPPDPWPVD